MTKPEVASAGLRTFFRIAERWSLTCEEQRILLGGPSRAMLFRWRKGPGTSTVGRDVIERISYVIGIYKALHELFANDAQADAWLRRPNDAPLFAGSAALDQMLRGQVSDLQVVRNYLDGVPVIDDTGQHSAPRHPVLGIFAEPAALGDVDESW